jgi:general secretion pathway protein F
MNEPTFSYRALASDGREERGVVRAPTRTAVAGLLADRGLHLIKVEEKHVVSRRPTLPVGELALALRLLGDLLDAGLPLARALQMLETMVAPSVGRVLPPALTAVREGQSLARAFEETQVTMPPEVLGILRAGERGSGLAAALRSAAELCDDAAATRAALRNALAYPLLLAVAGTGSLCLLVGIVLPRFAAILADLGQALPPTTRVVLRAGVLVREGALPAFGIAIVGVIVWRSWVGTEQGRRRWHALLLALPAVGETRRSAATARLCSSLAALLSSGVPLAPAIASAAAATGDAELTARLNGVRADVEHGSRLSDALQLHRAATDLVRRLVRAGEESGRLAPLLAHAGRLERERVLRRVQSSVRLIEPMLIVGFGGIVALVAAALLQALYSVRPA